MGLRESTPNHFRFNIMESDIFKKGFSTKSSYKLTDDSQPLFSGVHTSDPEHTTRIQIGSTRFHRVERAINWIYYKFKRFSFSEDNLK